jgi:hypothetical protein
MKNESFITKQFQNGDKWGILINFMGTNGDGAN